MRDLSLHVLDLVQNSVRAGASLITVEVSADEKKRITLSITDNGCGMSKELRERVLSPFATTRTTRKVGLGISLMAQNARLTGGDVAIQSEEGKGTVLTVTLDGGSIDCLPLGDLAGTMTTLIGANPEYPDFVLACRSHKGEMTFDTRQIRQVLEGVSLNEPEVTAWMLSSIQEEIEPIFGGVIL